MKLNTKNKIYILISSFFLSLLFFPFLYYQFFFKEINIKIKELNKTNKQVNYVETKIAQLKEIKKREEKIKEGIDRLNSLLVEKEIPLDFIKFIEETGKNCQTEFEITRFYNPNIKEEDGLIFDLKLKGKFYNIFCFLKRIENGSYLISIKNFNLYLEEKTKEEFLISLSLLAFTK